MVIHKTELDITDVQDFNISGLIEILSVGVQYGKLVMWFLRDTEYTVTHNVTVRIIGTGNPHGHNDTSGMTFMGTHLMANCQLVWHVWAIKT